MKYILLVSFILLYSCKSNQNAAFQQASSIEIININKPENISIDNVTETLGFINLEAKKGAYLGYVTKMRVWKDRLYLLDEFVAKRIFIYDIQGRHIKTIDNYGKGPNEFENITNFEIDRVNGEILASDYWNHKIFIYDLDGNYKRKVKVQWNIRDVVQLANRDIVCGKIPLPVDAKENQDGDRLLFADSQGNIYASGLKDDMFMSMFLSINDYLCSQSDGTATFLPALRDTIYTISSGVYKPKYALSFNTKRMNNDVFAQIKDHELSDKESEAGTFCIGVHAECDRFLYMRCGFTPEYSSNVFYSKRSHNIIHTSNRVFGRALTCDENNMFWGTVDRATVLDAGLGIFAQRLKEAFESSNGNPIVIHYKLKDF